MTNRQLKYILRKYPQARTSRRLQQVIAVRPKLLDQSKQYIHS